MQREDEADRGNEPGTNSSERAVNHLSKSVVRDTEGAAKQKPHATFCGNRGRATAPGDPVAGVQFPCATRHGVIARAPLEPPTHSRHAKEVGLRVAAHPGATVW